MKKQIKSIWIIAAIAIVLLLIGIIITLSKLGKNSAKNNGDQIDNVTATEEVINNCKLEDDEACIMNSTIEYKMYQYTEKNEDVEYLFDQLNTETKERMAEEKRDLMTNYPECSSLFDKYYYRNLTSNYVYYYEGKNTDILSITNEITYKDFCTGEERVEHSVYLYSKKLKDFIVDEQDMFEGFKLSKDQVNEIIVNYARKHDSKDIDPSKITKYQLFYNSYGQTEIKYKYDNGNEWLSARNEE